MYKQLVGQELKEAIEFTLTIFFKDEYNRGVFNGSKPVYIVVDDNGRYASRDNEPGSIQYQYRNDGYYNSEYRTNNFPHILDYDKVNPRPTTLVRVTKPE